MRTSMTASTCPSLSNAQTSSIIVVLLPFFWSIQLARSFISGTRSCYVFSTEQDALHLKQITINQVVLSVKWSLMIPQGITQFSENIVAVWEAVVLEFDTALLNFVKLSVITSMNWLAFNVFGRGFRRSIVINSKWSAAGNSCKGFIVSQMAYSGQTDNNLSECCKHYLLCMANHITFIKSRKYLSHAMPCNVG